MAIGKLQIEVSAQMEKLDTQLQKVEQQVKQTGQKIDNTMNAPAAKLALNMGAVFAVMGGIELATKSASAGISFLSAMSAEAEGNAAEAARHFEAMSETIKQLPMGIGPVATAIEDVMHKILQVDEALHRVAKAQVIAEGRELARDTFNEISDRIGLLEEERAIVAEQDEAKKRELEHERDHNKLRRDTKRLEEQIKNLNVDDKFKDTLLNRLAEEHGLQQDILNLKKEQEEVERRQAERIAIENEAMKRGIEQHRQKIALSNKSIQIAERMLGLGAGGTMGEKVGLTSTISTALGSFTSADMNVDNKIEQLQQDIYDENRKVARSTKRIEDLTEQIAAGMGIR